MKFRFYLSFKLLILVLNEKKYHLLGSTMINNYNSTQFTNISVTITPARVDYALEQCI